MAGRLQRALSLKVFLLLFFKGALETKKMMFCFVPMFICLCFEWVLVFVCSLSGVFLRSGCFLRFSRFFRVLKEG